MDDLGLAVFVSGTLFANLADSIFDVWEESEGTLFDALVGIRNLEKAFLAGDSDGGEIEGVNWVEEGEGLRLVSGFSLDHHIGCCLDVDLVAEGESGE